MSKERPMISVLMGVYYRRNDLFLLERAVKSILNQTFTDFEFLICDDGSTAEACRLLDKFAAADGRIHIIRDAEAPTDLAHKLNACLNNAAGEWIARMDDDDFSHSDRFEKQFAYLNEHAEISFVGCGVNLVCGGQNVGKKVLPACPQVEDFYMTQPYIHPTLLFRRMAIEAVDGYSVKPHQVLCEDYDLLLRLYEKGFQGANLQECLFDYTVLDSAKSNRKMIHRWNETVTRYERFRALKKLPGAFPYVIKPIVVGLIPNKILKRLKGY